MKNRKMLRRGQRGQQGDENTADTADVDLKVFIRVKVTIVPKNPSTID